MSFLIRKVQEEDETKEPRFSWKKTALTALTFLRPIAAWYDDYRKRKEVEERKTHRIQVLKKILVVLLSILCALGIITFLLSVLFHVQILSIKNLLSLTAAELPHDSRGATNILLLASGDANHEGVDLTDSMMVASLDPVETHSVVLLSLPRDLYLLKTERMGAGRINSLYRDYKNTLRRSQHLSTEEASKQALVEVMQELGKQLHIELHGAIKVDFTAFTQAVDTLGGVDVVVPQTLVDPEYPATEDSYETFSITAGPHHLDGETALKYARSRHSTSDFDRSARQQQILQALAEKVKTDGTLSNPGTMMELLKILGQHVEMTLGTRELLGLASMGLQIDRDALINYQLNDRNGLYELSAAPGGLLYAPPRDQFQGAAVLLPISIPESPVTWRQVQLFVQLLLENRRIYLSHTRIHVLNAGAPAGTARRLGNELLRFGFNVEKMENLKNTKLDHSFIAGEEAPPATAFFRSLLHLDAPSASQTVPPDPSADLTVVLGKDYKYKPLQELVPPPAESRLPSAPSSLPSMSSLAPSSLPPSA